MLHSWRSHLRGDIAGGLMSAVLAIPLAVGFGMFAFVSLGDEFFATGALAGLCAASALGFAMVVLGSGTTAVYAPRVNTTFVIGSLLYGLVNSDIEVLRSEASSLFAATFLAIMLLAGAFQVLFGLTRLGTLIKHTPHPVMAGFQNAAALLLFLVQLGNVMGFDGHVPFAAMAGQLGSAKPLNVIVAAVTFVVMWNSRKIVPKTPPLLVGMAVGTILYYGLAALGWADRLGRTIGEASFVFNPLSIPTDISFLELSALVSTIVGGAAALAIVASIDALLCARLVAGAEDARTNGDRLLVRFGLANMTSACVGGITSGFNIGASLANRTFGGRTPLSVLVNAAAIAVTAFALFPLIAYLPRVVLSAVIMVVAMQHVDPWSKRLFAHFVSGAGGRRGVLVVDLAVVLLVTGLSVAVNIVLAVFAGVAIAVCMFVVRMSRSTVRRTYRGDIMHSRKARISAEMETLEQHGGAIMVMELQGPLFFGTAEKLTNQVHAMSRDIAYLVLDLNRVSEIDSTGAEILLQLQAERRHAGVRFLVSSAKTSEAAARLLELGARNALRETFEDADRALEHAEDDLLREKLGERAPGTELSLRQVGVLANFSGDEIDLLATHLVRTSHEKGELVFRQDAPGDALFMIVRGSASAYLHRPGTADIRLAVFAPGALFGELALLDAGLRSATVIADEALVCHALSKDEFARLSANSPALAIKLLTGIARELAGRLRRANVMIDQLEA